MQARRAIAGALLCASSIALTACAPDDTADDADSTTSIILYQSRGIITQLPDPAVPTSEFQIHHEPMPAFKGNFNEAAPSGMNSMIMPFPLGKGVTLDGLNTGDLITFSFNVDYDAQTGTVAGFHITQLNKLPAETTLTFGKAPSPANPDAHSH